MQSKFDPFTQLLEQNKYFSKTFFKYLPSCKICLHVFCILTHRRRDGQTVGQIDKSREFYRTPLVKLRNDPAKHLNKFKSKYNQLESKKNWKHPKVSDKIAMKPNISTNTVFDASICLIYFKFWSKKQYSSWVFFTRVCTNLCFIHDTN